MATINCSICNAEEDVPFEPKEGSEVLCRACFKAKKKANKPPQKHIPRTKHGTRVSLFIDCSDCGKQAELDYVPKGTSIADALCGECAAKRFGDKSRWAEVNREKDAETRTEWAFNCHVCGREDYLKFAPDPKRIYECNRCYSDQEEPSKERLKDKAPVKKDNSFAKNTVFIRKRSDN